MDGVSKQDLVDRAKAHGYQRVSARLVDDWVAQGLLDRPEKQFLGYGRGSAPAHWPAEQCMLFLTLLQKRDERAPIAALCNIPVWLWLWWGDTYVSIRQMRQALRTWGKAVGYPPMGRARGDMRRLTGDWGHPEARKKDRRAFEEALYPMLCTGYVDGVALLPLVKRVFDPKGTRVPRGPVGGRLTPEGYVQILQARVNAITQLDAYENFHLEQARIGYLAMRHSYERERPRLAADPELGARFAAPELSEIVWDACLDLTTLLGMTSTPPDQAGVAT